MKSLVTYINETLRISHLCEYIQDLLNKEDNMLLEMATIQHNVPLGKDNYTIAIHGPSSKDRDNPHIHIYLTKDNSLKQFNFEISLVDLLTTGELVLIRQIDRTGKKKIDIKNRDKCSWDSYNKIKYDFEDWLEEKHKKLPQVFKDNLDSIIWNYNNEWEKKSDNYLLQYIKDKNKTILPEYNKYFLEEDKEIYPECFIKQ